MCSRKCIVPPTVQPLAGASPSGHKQTNKSSTERSLPLPLWLPAVALPSAIAEPSALQWSEGSGKQQLEHTVAYRSKPPDQVRMSMRQYPFALQRSVLNSTDFRHRCSPSDSAATADPGCVTATPPSSNGSALPTSAPCMNSDPPPPHSRVVHVTRLADMVRRRGMGSGWRDGPS